MGEAVVDATTMPDPERTAMEHEIFPLPVLVM